MFLVTGANGQLGNELKIVLGEKTVYIDIDELDITDEVVVKQFFDQNTFDIVINCAAYTAVDKAEDEPEKADKINREGVLNLSKYGKRIIHISTDYVFDGKNYKPYTEEDNPCPESIYGKTKLAGEKTLFENAETAIIIRTAWLYSQFGNNFVKTMQRLGTERGEVNVIFDQIGTPTYAGDLAKAITEILPQIKDGTKKLYHFSNEGVCSWYDFAWEIMKLSGIVCKVTPIESKDYPTKAHRPFYSVLNKRKIKEDFGIEIPHWQNGLARCLEKIKREG